MNINKPNNLTNDIENNLTPVTITAYIPKLPNENCLFIYRLSKTVRLLAILDLLFGFLMIFFGRLGYYILYRLVSSISGYLGAKKYDLCLSSFYLVFLSLGVILELLIIFVLNKLYIDKEINKDTLIFGVIYQIIFFTLKLYITRFVCKFVNKIQTIGDICRKQLIDYDSQPVQIVYW